MRTEIILSIVVASATIIYTLTTIFQLIESRRVRLQNETPSIIPYLQSSENHKVMMLCIKNFGSGVAKDVKVEIIKDYNLFGKDRKLSMVGIVENGMNYFVPGFEFTFYLNSIVELNTKHKNDALEMKILYKNLGSREFNQTFILPFNQMFGQLYSTPPETYMGQIPYYLNGINKELKKINEK